MPSARYRRDACVAVGLAVVLGTASVVDGGTVESLIKRSVGAWAAAGPLPITSPANRSPTAPSTRRFGR